MIVSYRIIHALCLWSVSQASLNYESPTAQQKYWKHQAPEAQKTCKEISYRGYAAGLNILELISVSYVETRHTKNLVSPAGARGPLQALPRYWKRKGDKDHITSGLRAWKYYREKSTSLREAAGKYNGGGAGGQYAQDVQAHYDELKKLYALLRWPL